MISAKVNYEQNPIFFFYFLDFDFTNSMRLNNNNNFMLSAKQCYNDYIRIQRLYEELCIYSKFLALMPQQRESNYVYTWERVVLWATLLHCAMRERNKRYNMLSSLSLLTSLRLGVKLIKFGTHTHTQRTSLWCFEREIIYNESNVAHSCDLFFSCL